MRIALLSYIHGNVHALDAVPICQAPAYRERRPQQRRAARDLRQLCGFYKLMLFPTGPHTIARTPSAKWTVSNAPSSASSLAFCPAKTMRWENITCKLRPK